MIPLEPQSYTSRRFSLFLLAGIICCLAMFSCSSSSETPGRGGAEEVAKTDVSGAQGEGKPGSVPSGDSRARAGIAAEARPDGLAPPSQSGQPGSPLPPPGPNGGPPGPLPPGGPHSGPPGKLPPPVRVPAEPGRYEPVGDVGTTPSTEDEPINVLFISLDTVRADTLSCYGHPSFKTPTIDRLARSGARFENAFTHIPETALSHWTIFTSIEPPLHGNVNRFGTSRYVGPLAQEIFKAKGYVTGAIIGGVTLRSDVGLQRGFDTYDENYPFGAGKLKRPGGDVTRQAIAFVQAHRHQPFFLFVHYFDAHFPYVPPPPYNTRYDASYQGSIDGSDEKLTPIRDGKREISPRDLEHVRALYGGEIAYLDDQLESLLSALSVAGVAEKTLIVLFSDHGESFEHGYLFNHAGVLYDATLHIPLIFALPGHIKPGTEIETQVRTIDILPTALDLVGLPMDKKFQGKSLLPLLKGKQTASPAVFSLTDPWREGSLTSIREEGWKLILGPRSKSLLFEVSRDPQELQPNTEADHPIKKVLSKALEDHQEELLGLEPLLMGPPLKPKPMLSPEEVEQLRVLGYLKEEE